MSDPGDARSVLLEHLAAAVLDPVLCAGPFRRGDDKPPSTDTLVGEWPSPWPEPERSVQLLWCASSSDVSGELPGLWCQVRGQVPDTGGCVDVTVDLDVLGRLVAADVEAVPLGDLLLGVGENEAASAAAELPGLSAEVAIPALADLLERLLAASGPGNFPGSHPRPE